ncbi:MAG: aldo/keto reductase [Polyangiaceae bacterium]|nr:aldo/keto reductase [Polyangiaceae bacterium]
MTRTPNLSPALPLRDGRAIPRLGLGVFQARSGGETRAAVRAALEIGYRHIDTARIYGNEDDVGKAIAECGVPREEIFVTTKLWNSDHGYESAIRACRGSLSRLGLSYVDLYLIHWPVPERRKESWRALVKLQEEGLCRSIGVSNYMIRHLDELQSSSPVLPAVNQVELSPFCRRGELVEHCRALGIVLEAYSPLTRGERLGHPAVIAVAEALGRTPAQVLIRWALQHGLVALPKSTRRARIEENAAVFDFEIGAEQMRMLDGLDEGLVTGWDPTDAP